MKCEKCGNEYEGNFCPNCGKAPKQKKPVLKKWWFWVIVVVLVLAIFSAMGGETTEDKGKTNEPQTSESQQGGESESAQGDESESTEPEEEKPENVYSLGESFEAKGLKVTFEKAERWESDNMFSQPHDGNIYIRVYVSGENIGKTDRFIWSYDFDCYADGAATTTPLVGTETLTGGTISSGRKTAGYIYFEIPANTETVEVEYETSFWTDKKAILKFALSDI